MRILLLVLLFLSFAYSLGLVLGLLLILCLILGIVIGMLLALLIFRVLQNKWEISRLQKLNTNLQEQVTQANIVIDRQANAPSVQEAVYGATATNVQDGSISDVDDGATLTKQKREH